MLREKKGKKGHKPILGKWKKNTLAGPKNNRMGKNEMGMGKYSPRYHAHKISRQISAQKNYARDTVEL